MEWSLLAAGRLPAPYVPDPHLVYAKDVVPPLSEDGQEAKPGRASAEAEPALRWMRRSEPTSKTIVGTRRAPGDTKAASGIVHSRPMVSADQKRLLR